jgi:hypothetical protein
MTVTGMVGAGCTHLGAGHGEKEAGDAAGQSREFAMNQRWQNQPLSRLVDALGKPKLLLSIPGGGNPPGFIAFYGLDPATGCIDAFALVYGVNPAIRAYYCR